MKATPLLSQEISGLASRLPLETTKKSVNAFKADGREDKAPLSKHTAWAWPRCGMLGLQSMARIQSYYSWDPVWLPDSTGLLVSPVTG